jgi:hypothetical protein
MKDTQIERSSPGRIPGISPLLHFVSMTTLVYLRSSFGYVYLRSKLVFFAFSWAFLLFTFAAWHEPEFWREYRAVCIFGTGAVALYWLHVVFSASSQLKRSAEHDQYSGTSHGSRLFSSRDVSTTKLETNLHLWGEPLAVLVFSAFLRFAFGERHLSTWLVVAAGCMACKEGLNYWFKLRRDKIQDDMVGDAKEQGETLPDSQIRAEAPKATRKEQVTRKRNAASAEESARERRFVELLRLRVPFTLEKAEENYRTLIALEHPDKHGSSPESTERTTELNEAIEFFRGRLRN